jgi:uncharacterized membrane protein YfhO
MLRGALLPAAVFLLIFFRFGIVPFGERTLLISDLDTQYVEFMAEYRRVLLGEGSLFWSWHAGLGMNFLALVAYYLASPFNLLLVFFPENGIPAAVSVLTVLKIGCAGAAFAFYLRRHGGNPERSRTAVYAGCYALSAYVVGYAFNIMWLDAVIWLPLLCAGIDRMLAGDGKGSAGLTGLLALSFISQFYMAWMTGVFCGLYFCAEVMIRRISLRKIIIIAFRFAVCVGIAAGLSAFLLLPTFYVLKNNMGLMGQEFPEAGGGFRFMDIIRKMFLGSFDGVKDCLPHIYCGLAGVVGMIRFFIRRDVPVRERAVSAVMTGLLLLSFWFRPLDFIWHAMDHPSWFPYRYAFVFCFWMLRLAYRGSAGGGCDTGRDKALICGTAAVMLLLAGIGIKEGSVRFLMLNGGFLAAYAAAGFIRERRVRTLFAAAELFVNGCLIISIFSEGYTKYEDYREFHDHYRGQMAEIQPAGNEFYRIEKGEFRNYNDPLGIGYPGISHFSSTASVRQTEYLKRLGFNCYATWCSYEGATSAADMLLGIRYETGPGGKQDSFPAGEEIREHASVFPLFYFAGEEFARYDYEAEMDAIMRQDDLLKLLAGEDSDFFSPVPVKITRLENLGKDGEDLRKTDTSQPAYIEAEVDAVENASLYLLIPGASLSHTVKVEGTELMNGGRDYAPFPICLDGFGEDGTIKITIEAAADVISGRINVWALDTGRLSALSRSVRSTAPEMKRNGVTGFILDADAATVDRLMVSSIPFDAGWQVKIDGKIQPQKTIHGGMLGFVFPAGSREAEVSFRPYGFETGLAVSAVSLLLWAAVFVLEKRRKGIPD